jgi:DNA repair protein RecN (Recombination protein N)
MLSYISVKNFAIIENIEVDFSKGMTAVTGETGAGKSLLIDAIGLLLGDRATSNVVRTGSSKAEVEGIFISNNPKIKSLLQSFDCEQQDDELIIKRQINTSNSNIIKINNTVVTLSQLKEVTSLLADIHTQHDTHRLINPQTYLDVIDGFTTEETTVLIKEYQTALSAYKGALKELKRLQNSNNDLLDRLDLMKYQEKELLAYQLDVEEELELQEKISKMQNFDKIYQNLNEAKQAIEVTGALDNIFHAIKMIGHVESYDENLSAIKKRMEEAYYELDDTFEELKSEVDDLDFDPKQLDVYQDRMNSLESLKRKYRKDIGELIEYLAQISKDLSNIDNFDEVIADQTNVVKETFAVVKKAAENLTKLREKTSRYIELELIKNLEALELKKTSFEIVFIRSIDNDFMNSSQFLDHGIDEVDFLITTNVGEPLKPLSKTASGGEMSRIMLGLKNLLVQSLNLSLIIFDEIDSGVSGYIASQVAKKMKDISKTTQVICITHIPQVAAISDHHLYISKRVESDRTKAHIKVLEGNDKVMEIAQMISGENVTEAAISSAKELLKN